jgi:deazaflavin-dependent oxidoreductase (nitroreductase family)
MIASVELQASPCGWDDRVMPTPRLRTDRDPHTQQGAIYRVFVRLASCRLANWLASKRVWGSIVWRIDRRLLPLTRGRLGTGLLLPTALLETRGARTGEIRRTAVIYFHDGEDAIVIASHAGRPGNPAWFYNARANPEVVLGYSPFRAEVVEDEAERIRLWELADRVFPAFAAYRTSAATSGRAIPILRLVPR